MKNNYESRSKTFLTRRTPVIIRIDGKAFHTYTKGLEKPFDEGLISDMQETMLFLCNNIQGAKLGYHQSDEISILVTDYEKLTTDAWFDYNVQKMTSISSSLTTAMFNKKRYERSRYKDSGSDSDGFGHSFSWDVNIVELDLPLAFFDSRAFNIPKEEVANYFLSRQKDAVKNSVAMLAQSWNDLSSDKKRGSIAIKEENGWLLKDSPIIFNHDFFNNLI